MKVALIQMQATNDEHVNICKALGFVKKAAERKANFVLLPELFTYRGKLPSEESFKYIAESIPGETTDLFTAVAKTDKISILLGSIYERTNDTKKAYNTSILINPQGKIAVTYRKKNLFEAKVGRKKIQEDKWLVPGKKATLTKVKKFKTGLSVCYDLRFPELYRTYAKAGAEILCVPSNFTRQTGQAHWEVLLRSRAIENLCYVLAPNQIGKDNKGIESFGHSMVIGPWGEILAQGSPDKEEIIFASLNKKVLKEKRALLPKINKGKS